MSQTRRFISDFFTINRPAWQREIPRRLRVAAEWQFGTVPLMAAISLFRGDFVGALVMASISAILFIFTSGWSPGRRINSPLLWWVFVLATSTVAAFTLVYVLIDPPE